MAVTAIIPGLIDTRDVKERQSNGSIKFFPTNDCMYGPYNSIAAAWDKLSETSPGGNNALVIGRTVGILQLDGSIKEYWFQKACASMSDLVEKTGSSSSSGDDGPGPGTIAPGSVNEEVLSEGIKNKLENGSTALDKVQTIEGQLQEVQLGDISTNKQSIEALTPRVSTVESELSELSTEVEGKEDVSNKTTTLNESSTNDQYPTAKAVYDGLKTKVTYVDQGASGGTLPQVLYIPQTLTEQQKAQARANIGVTSSGNDTDSTVEVDPFLITEGMAADAKATGDAIRELKEAGCNVDTFNYVHSGIVSPVIQNSLPEPTAIIFSTARNTFVAVDGNGAYYATWPEFEKFGTSSVNGVVPVKDKLYLSANSNTSAAPNLYVFDGTTLKNVAGNNIEIADDLNTENKAAESKKVGEELNTLTDLINSKKKTVVPFDSISNILPAQIQAGSALNPDYIAYSPATNTFIAVGTQNGGTFISGSYYSNWGNGDEFGTSTVYGRTPLEDVLYLMKGDADNPPVLYMYDSNKSALVRVSPEEDNTQNHASILEFDYVFTGNSSVSQTTPASYDRIVYNSNINRFNAVNGSTLHNNWPGAEEFGTPDTINRNGIIPKKGLIYHSKESNSSGETVLYVSNGTKLVKVGESTVIDPTFSVDGAAADAVMTGIKLTEIENTLGDIETILTNILG